MLPTSANSSVQIPYQCPILFLVQWRLTSGELNYFNTLKFPGIPLKRYVKQTISSIEILSLPEVMLTGMAPLECLCHRNPIPGKTFKSSIWFRRLICDLFFSLIALESMRIFLQPCLLCNKSLHYFFIKQEQVRNVKSARWHQNKNYKIRPTER